MPQRPAQAGHCGLRSASPKCIAMVGAPATDNTVSAVLSHLSGECIPERPGADFAHSSRTWTINCLTRFGCVVHVRRISWIKGLFSDTAMPRARVIAGLERMRQQGKTLGRPKVSPKVEDAIRKRLGGWLWHIEGGGDGWRRERHRAAGDG
jgi:hypothetical protein